MVGGVRRDALTVPLRPGAAIPNVTIAKRASFLAVWKYKASPRRSVTSLTEMRWNVECRPGDTIPTRRVSANSPFTLSAPIAADSPG